MELSRLGRRELMCLYLLVMVARHRSSTSLRFRKQEGMVVTGDLDRAVMNLRQVRMVAQVETVVMRTTQADLLVGIARAAKGRMVALEAMEHRKETTEARTGTLDREAMENRTATQIQATMEDRTATPDQEAMEDRAATPDQEATEALTMVLANRTQAVSHKSTCTRRS